MSAPPAAGARIAWLEVPEAVRAAIEAICGSAIIEARTQPGGFSPGVAARVRCADGTRWFVKAASAELNPDAPRFHRRESRVLADLDPVILARHLPVPRLRGTVADGPWFALIIDDVEGRPPATPWRDHELDRVVTALDQLAGELTPGPAAVMPGVPAIAEYLGRDFTGSVSRESLAAVVCAVAGYFTAASLQPPPPGLPTLRQFQTALGEVTRRWLATLL